MKKIFLVLFSIIFLFSLPLFATSNSQEYYSVSSLEWQTVNELCHYAGVVGPTSNGPVTKAQLLLALDRAEKVLDSDNPILLDVKAKLDNDYALYKDDFGSIFVEAILSPEFYYQTNEPYEAEPSWNKDSSWAIKNHQERSSAAILTLENTLGDYLYTRFSLEARQKVGGDSFIWNKKNHFNFIGSRLAQNFPFDAGVALGAKGLSLIIARGKVSLGEGKTGNTAIGDNYDYQEFMKAGFYTRNSSVFITLTSFDSSRSENLMPWQVNTSQFSGYKNIRHSSVYEMTLFDKHKLSLALITLLDTSTAFDFRYLNPFMILHNMYNFHQGHSLEANNMISLDYSSSFLPKWNLYLQITMDQFQIKGEAQHYEENIGYIDPNAFGALVNVSYTDIVNRDSIYTLYGEAVYNMPGMYLNSKYYEDNLNVTQKKNDKYCWSQDYLLGYSREEENGDDMAYSGYIYGPDCFVLSFGGKYRRVGKYSIAFSAFYMAHGEKGRGDNPSNYNFDKLDTKDKINSIALTDTVEHSLIAKVEADIQLLEDLSLSLGGAYQYRWNYRNKENKTFSNLQIFVGFNLSTAHFSV